MGGPVIEITIMVRLPGVAVEITQVMARIGGVRSHGPRALSYGIFRGALQSFGNDGKRAIFRKD